MKQNGLYQLLHFCELRINNDHALGVVVKHFAGVFEHDRKISIQRAVIHQLHLQNAAIKLALQAFGEHLCVFLEAGQRKNRFQENQDRAISRARNKTKEYPAPGLDQPLPDPPE